VYVAGIIADYLHEFSQTGTTLEVIMPHVRNGRLYFITIGLATNNGFLVSGDEILLPSLQAWNVSAQYSGVQINIADSQYAFTVAGFAEKGSIVITHAFTDYTIAEAWSQSVKTNTIY
jgi:hypothetical protein